MATPPDETTERLDRLTRVVDRLESQVGRLTALVDRLAAGEAAAETKASTNGRHRRRGPIEDAKHLRDVAEEGESPATPLIITLGLILLLIPLAAIMIGAVIFVPRWLTSGDSNSPPAPAAAPAWALPNGDLSNTRLTHGSPISSSNVSQLGVAWTQPLTAGSVYGTFAANPVISNGVVYLQDLASNVWATSLATGKVLWRHNYNSKSLGPNGVTYVNGVLYGETASYAFALDAKTGHELWRNTTLIATALTHASGGEGGPNFFIDLQPQVANGKVYLASAALPGGGLAWALDAKTGKTLWTFNTAPDPASKKFVGGGAWDPPAVAPDGTVYLGTANMYQPYAEAVAHPTPRHYIDSTVALDGQTGKLKWFYQAEPNDFYDWDMQLSPILSSIGGRDVVIDSGKMGYVYEFDAKTGKLLWKTSVGVHNGHDHDNLRAMAHKLKLHFPLTVEPGIAGGVETNMALAGGVIYAPIANLSSGYKTPTTTLGSATFGNGKGEMVALDAKNGNILWDTKLPQMADGDATVVNDLVFTTTFDGHLIALARSSGKVVWDKKLPAFTNAPVAVSGDTLVTAASYPGGAGQIAEIVAFRIGAHGSFKPVQQSSGGSSSGASADGKTLFTQNCASCHTLAAANATGAVGPNLDQLKPSEALLIHQITNGGGGMPAFGGRLTDAEIKAIAAYVAGVAGK
jgi:outer membrane protein assembly factor BamB